MDTVQVKAAVAELREAVRVVRRELPTSPDLVKLEEAALAAAVVLDELALENGSCCMEL